MVTVDEEREKPQHVKYESDHERRLWPDEADRSITCWTDEVLTNDRLRLRPAIVAELEKRGFAVKLVGG